MSCIIKSMMTMMKGVELHCHFHWFMWYTDFSDFITWKKIKHGKLRSSCKCQAQWHSPTEERHLNTMRMSFLGRRAGVQCVSSVTLYLVSPLLQMQTIKKSQYYGNIMVNILRRRVWSSKTSPDSKKKKAKAAKRNDGQQTRPLPLLWSHPSLTTVTSFMLGQNTLWTGRGVQTSWWKLCKVFLLVRCPTEIQLKERTI